MEAIARLTFGWFWSQTAYLAISQINAMDFALLTFRIKGVAIGKCGPIAVANSFLTLDSTRSHPIFIVLKSARNSEIRFRVIKRNPIIFSRRNLVQMIPVFAAGETLIDTAICSKQQALANWRFRRLVFIFRFWRLRRRCCAGLNRES